MNMGPEILIIDDEQDICELVAGILEDDGFQTRSAYDSAGAIKEITARQPDLVLLDIWLQNSHMDGLELLKEIKKCAPNLPVVMISGHGNIETAVTALKNGAHDYIEKPFETEKLLLVIKRIIERMALKRENDELRMRAGIPLKLIGSSRIVEQLQNHINKIAVTGSRVFIQGETGSGKEVVARLLYKQSSRADGPFIAVNSAVLSSTHLEEVLFGRIRNGRVEPGLFERAHRGVLFFDEIGEMPLETQGRIVRLLVEQKFTRIGDSTPVEVDVRVFSSSTHYPQSLIDTGRLREDLFHRLNVLSLHVPPLSKRREDIPDLIEYFSDELSRISGLSKCPISKETLSILQYYKWPGNV
ncbi:MAG: sigma-54-dependent transcriptional regulator, partial [Parvibaculales bacterium]